MIATKLTPHEIIKIAFSATRQKVATRLFNHLRLQALQSPTQIAQTIRDYSEPTVAKVLQIMCSWGIVDFTTRGQEKLYYITSKPCLFQSHQQWLSHNHCLILKFLLMFKLGDQINPRGLAREYYDSNRIPTEMVIKTFQELHAQNILKYDVIQNRDVFVIIEYDRDRLEKLYEKYNKGTEEVKINTSVQPIELNKASKVVSNVTTRYNKMTEEVVENFIKEINEIIRNHPNITINDISEKLSPETKEKVGCYSKKPALHRFIKAYKIKVAHSNRGKRQYFTDVKNQIVEKLKDWTTKDEIEEIYLSSSDDYKPHHSRVATITRKLIKPAELEIMHNEKGKVYRIKTLIQQRDTNLTLTLIDSKVSNLSAEAMRVWLSEIRPALQTN